MAAPKPQELPRSKLYFVRLTFSFLLHLTYRFCPRRNQILAKAAIFAGFYNADLSDKIFISYGWVVAHCIDMSCPIDKPLRSRVIYGINGS